MHSQATTSTAHGYTAGDMVGLDDGGGIWRRVRRLLRRPRVFVVSECTATTFSVEERRMTWAEWRGAMWRALTRGDR